MPFCQNQDCGKTELKREEVEFDDEKKLVVCQECYAAEHGITILPTMKPKVPVEYDISITSKGGVKAELKVGEVTFGLEASPAQIQKLLKSNHG